MLARNVIALVERPKTPTDDLPHAETPRHDHRQVVDPRRGRAVPRFGARSPAVRLLAAVLLRLAPLRSARPAVVRTSTAIRRAVVRRGRVAVGTETVEGAAQVTPVAAAICRCRAELAEALRVLKIRQKEEALALGVEWSDDRLIAVHEDGTPFGRNGIRTSFTGCASAPGCAASACTGCATPA